MISLSAMFKNSKRAIQKVRSKSSDQKTEEPVIYDQQMLKAMGETLLGVSIHPQALLKAVKKKDK